MTFVDIAWIALWVFLAGAVGTTCVAIFLHNTRGGSAAWNTISAMLAVFFVVTGVVNFIANAPRAPTCVATPGQRVAWVESRDSSRFVYVDQGAKLYCRVYDARLYYLGIGTILETTYDGYPETRP